MKTPSEILAEDRLWTVAEVARFLGMSTSWVYKAAEAGMLPAVNVGARLRFDPEQVKAYVRRCTRGVTDPENVVAFGRRG